MLNNSLQVDNSHNIHDIKHIQLNSFQQKHIGHESLHIILMLLMLFIMTISQIALILWKKYSIRTYDQITLIGLLLFPLLYSIYNIYLRFIIIWIIFITITAYYVSRPFLEKPLNVKTPRAVYWYFFLCNKISFGIAFTGYAILLLDAIGGRLGLANFGLLLLFYGLLYGVISRDLAVVSSDRMAGALGFDSRGGIPSRLVDARVCSICSDTLDSVTEDSITLPGCGHVFHAFCIRGWSIVGKKECPSCRERVELSQVFQQPWEKQSVLWAYVLDITRYMVVWNPILIVAIQWIIRFFDS